ncbi:hypothetical protein [Methylocapsa aurea]|jgi:hypothetical protein|uniref:hypothetical protein n=1 Tax=Methylocapsa aurea TaxID=663610 RepID=UPI003D18B62D
MFSGGVSDRMKEIASMLSISARHFGSDRFASRWAACIGATDEKPPTYPAVPFTGRSWNQRATTPLAAAEIPDTTRPAVSAPSLPI